MFDRDGSDAMRWFLMASPILRGGNLVVTEQGIREGVRQALLPLWNTWYFLALYAERGGASTGACRTDSPHVLDRYVLAKTASLVDDVTAAMDVYDIAGACGAGARPRSRCSPTGTCGGPGTGSGPATRTRSTPCTRCSR